MNPIRVLAKINANTTNYSGAGGGATEFDMATCASLCKGVNDRYFNAARLKWCKDWSAATKLDQPLWDYVVTVSIREKWVAPKRKGKRIKEFYRRMAWVAMLETAEPLKFKYDVKKALYMGIDSRTFARIWKGKYNDVFAEVNDWANTMYRQINRAQNID